MNDRLAIVVLGASNSAEGVLSAIARERAERALEEYRKHPGAKVVCTGGWAKHFNVAEKPHGHYMAEHLKSRGVPADAFLECAESTNTIEDAQLSRSILDRHGIASLVVVTSDFHLARARFLFEREFPDKSLSFAGAKTHLTGAELAKRIAHEEQAMAKLRGQPTA